STDGTGFSLLHSFSGGSSDGGIPTDSLIQSGSILFGMTSHTGGANLGTIFTVKSDGTAFNLLHSFTGGTADGNFPLGSLIQSGSTLYGMTYRGGSSNKGTVFQIGTDGTGFSVLHSF